MIYLIQFQNQIGILTMIVLDTHIWLWWINNNIDKLGLNRQEKIERSDSLAISIISCLELAWLERHKRISLSCNLLEWIEKSSKGSGIIILPLTPQIVVTAVDLPKHHKDPQDRLIIATALIHNAFLSTADQKFEKYTELAGKLV